MDNHLTPNKIQKLIRLAEDKSFNANKISQINEEDLLRNAVNSTSLNKSAVQYESSSGILDLENIEAFGESGGISLGKISVFKPGEMTGRSTGTEDVTAKLSQAMNPRSPEKLKSKLCPTTLQVNSLYQRMDQTSKDINDFLTKHSISAAESFHSKKDLTAAEMSFVKNEAPLPVIQSTLPLITDSHLLENSSGVSTYFKSKCPDFTKIFGRVDSPLDSMINSITEVSSSIHLDGNDEMHELNESLDSIPVKQPRNNNADNYSKKTENPKKNLPIKGPPPVRHDVQETIKRFSSMQSAEDFLKNIDTTKTNAAKNESSQFSLSISKIADYIQKDGKVSVTDLINLNKNKKQPLSELQMNMQNSRVVNVTYLKDTKKAETASSAGSVDTIISASAHKTKENIQVPKIVTSLVPDGIKNVDNDNIKTTKDTKPKTPTKNIEEERVRSRSRSKSPLTKSSSTLSTVQEKYSGFNYSGNTSSPPMPKGDTVSGPVLSPNAQYKELDKSVDWKDVLQQKRQLRQSLAKEKWAEIVATPVTGFVGIRCPISISINNLIDSWLIAKLEFDQHQKDFSVEMPRVPLVLSPVKQEEITLYLTPNVEINEKLPFTLYLKDASLELDVEQKENIDVNIKMPIVQAMSSDGMNKVVFKALQNTSITKSLVLISDCPVDLQLDLSLADPHNNYTIKNVQEIKKSDVNKILLDRQGSTEDAGRTKAKSKVKNKLLCRLTSGNAIKVTITFNAPIVNSKLKEIIMITRSLDVKMIGVDVVLKVIELTGQVGFVNLHVQSVGDKMRVVNDSSIKLYNSGTMCGNWVIKYKSKVSSDNNCPFKFSISEFELGPMDSTTVKVTYMGSEECHGVLIFEETSSGTEASIDICGGADKPKSFPIKTSHNNMSWVRPARKDLSLKNSTDKKFYLICQILGKGFSIDMPGPDVAMCRLTFDAYECKTLPILYSPTVNTPQAAALHLMFKKDNDISRKVNLFGCASGDTVRWDGHVTYGTTALVRAVTNAPIQLKLYNRSNTPVFVAANVHFLVKFHSLSGTCEVRGGRCVVGARASHTLSLAVDWSRIERLALAPPAASTLATLSVLTGAETTRRRILRILRGESKGELDLSLIPDHLKVLTGKFEDEDATIDDLLENFNETKTSLNELIGGIQELPAQVELPPDFGDETIVITDETVFDHHTIAN